MKKILDYIQLIVSIATIVGVYFAYDGVMNTLDLQRETFAVQMFSAYSDHYAGKPAFIDTSFTHYEKNWKPEYKVFAQHALFTSESIFNMRGESSAWNKTIYYMLIPHLHYYEKDKLVDNAYSEEFREYYNKIKMNSGITVLK